LVKYLLGRMVAAAHPQAIWLFGSRAGGDARPDSDFDLLAVFPDDDALDLDTRRHQLADAVMGAGIGTDIAVCTASEFAACHDMAGSLIRTVHEPGREVYAAPAERRRRREPA
jgi:predicted nucleotidyltransferase